MIKASLALSSAVAITGVILLLTGCTNTFSGVDSEEQTPENNSGGLQLGRYEETRSLMDTFVNITLYTSSQENAAEAFDAAFVKMEEIEDKASIFDENSEAFRLNRDGYLENPSEDFRKMMDLSLEYSQFTDGYFDITVQPLLELWEGGLWQESETVQEQRIAETMTMVGYDKLVVEEDRVSFSVEGMEITLGGIAKGYAVDAALEVIQDQGIEHALINAGGDMIVLGTKAQGQMWKVALVNPDNTSQSLAEFALADNAIATSGNYERYFDPEKTAHHIINPKTGYSAAECISTTVIAPSVTQADALATGIFVMGPDEGIDLIESLDNAECLIVDNYREIHLSSGLSKHILTG
jgi:thiamine biosynthesis lipoprotein